VVEWPRNDGKMASSSRLSRGVQRSMSPKVRKSLIVWLGIVAALVAVPFVIREPEHARIRWQVLTDAVEAGEVGRIDVELDGGTGVGRGWLGDGSRFITASRPIGDFAELQPKGVAVVFREPQNTWQSSATVLLPLVFLVLFFVFLRRLTHSTKNSVNVLNFEPLPEPIRGPIEVPAAAAKLRERLAGAANAMKTGAPGPRRVLITGRAGTGKTMLLKAVAADSGLPAVLLSGSSFVEVFVGVGSARIRKLFEKAAQAAPCIVAIDDVDSFATRRVLPDNDGRVDERGSTLLELCNQLAGVRPMPERVLFIATTSRPDLLDETITRPGRFDWQLSIESDTPTS
jgi:cell division protease FtsH